MGKYWFSSELVADLPFVGPNHYVITDPSYFHDVKQLGSGVVDGHQWLTVQLKDSQAYHWNLSMVINQSL